MKNTKNLVEEVRKQRRFCNNFLWVLTHIQPKKSKSFMSESFRFNNIIFSYQQIRKLMSLIKNKF